MSQIEQDIEIQGKQKKEFQVVKVGGESGGHNVQQPVFPAVSLQGTESKPGGDRTGRDPDGVGARVLGVPDKEWMNRQESGGDQAGTTAANTMSQRVDARNPCNAAEHWQQTHEKLARAEHCGPGPKQGESQRRLRVPDRNVTL